MALITKSVESTTLLGIGGFEDQLNTFLSTLDPKNVLDIMVDVEKIGKYGQETTYYALIIYKT